MKKNPFGEVCSLTCAANQLCQRRCYRREFTGTSVRIAELQRWVCAEAGLQGWIKHDQKRSSAKVAAIGGGPAAMSCAYYLALTGYEVSMYARETQPGGKLWEKSASDQHLRIALIHDIQGMMAAGISFQKINTEKESENLLEILKNHEAIFITDPIAKGVMEKNVGQLNPDVQENTQKHVEWNFAPGVFIGEDFMSNGTNVVKAAANGRRKAVEISQYLASQV